MSEPYFEFFVPGDPAPQGSKTMTPTGHMRESSKRVKPWRKAVAWYALVGRSRGTLQGEVRVDLEFITKRKLADDGDKLERATFDGLTEGGIWVDDRYVVESHWTKRRPANGEETGCWVRVWAASPSK